MAILRHDSRFDDKTIEIEKKPTGNTFTDYLLFS